MVVTKRAQESKQNWQEDQTVEKTKEDDQDKNLWKKKQGLISHNRLPSSDCARGL